VRPYLVGRCLTRTGPYAYCNWAYFNWAEISIKALTKPQRKLIYPACICVIWLVVMCLWKSWALGPGLGKVE
jgi:hypothetical protein